MEALLLQFRIGKSDEKVFLVMSMPQFLSVAVISARVSSKNSSAHSGDLASTVAAILRDETHHKSVAPNIIPVALNQQRHPNLVEFALKEHITLRKVVFPQSLNPQEIHIWLALDDEGLELAKERILQDGPSPGGFYREVFPEAVISCGFFAPDPPPRTDYKPWFDFLTEKFTPWRQKIWKAFSDSS